MDTEVTADVVVVGSGTAAYCTAYDLAEKRVNTLLLLQGSPGRKNNSVVQIPHSGTEALKQRTFDAISRWNVIQKAAKFQLIKSAPLVILGRDQELLETIEKNISSHRFKPKWISIHQLDQQYGCHIPDDVLALENPAATYINSNECLQALHNQFKRVGGQLMTDWHIENITPGEPYITLHGINGNIIAKKLLLCPGPQEDELLRFLGVDFITREVEIESHNPKLDNELPSLNVIARSEADYKYICSKMMQWNPMKLRVTQEANFDVNQHAVYSNIIYSLVSKADELLLAPVIGRAMSCLARNVPLDHHMISFKPLQSTL